MAALILSSGCSARRHLFCFFSLPLLLLLLNQSADQRILTRVRLGRTLRMALHPAPQIQTAAVAAQTPAARTTAARKSFAAGKSLTPGKGSAAAVAAEELSTEAWVLVRHVGWASEDLNWDCSPPKLPSRTGWSAHCTCTALLSTQRKHDSHHGFSASSNSFQPDQIISLESSSAGLSCCDPVCALVVDVAFLHIGKVSLRRWTIIVCVTLTTHLGMEYGYISVLQTEI